MVSGSSCCLFKGTFLGRPDASQVVYWNVGMSQRCHLRTHALRQKHPTGSPRRHAREMPRIGYLDEAAPAEFLDARGEGLSRLIPSKAPVALCGREHS